MADHDKIWSKFEDCFNQRRWNTIRTSWPQFMGSPIEPPGCAPAIRLSDILEAGGIFNSLPEKNKLTIIEQARSEIPDVVFREAVYWLHKALHVLGASETHVNLGLPTWSLSSAYQSGYFAARSILAFFGVTVAELQKVSIAVDICRDMRGIRPQKMAELGAFGENITFQSIGVLFDHRQVWLLFQRILRTSTCLIWPDGWANYLSTLEVGDFTRQRHGLHYQLPYWVEADLQEFLYPDRFDNIVPTGSGRELFDAESTNFSLVMGVTMTRMALSLFNDLCGLTNRLTNERAKMLSTLSSERHPLFAETLLRHVETPG